MRKCSLILIIFLINLRVAYSIERISLKLGADNLSEITSIVRGKRVAFAVNQTSKLSNGVFLVDTLLSLGVNVRKIFAPEHGFRGDADAGEKIQDSKDAKTGLDVVSLYGKNYKPQPEQLEDVDAVIFDIQDVGTRFYTYISTLHYLMQACAEKGIEVIVLDRPNPNDVVDGPVLDLKYRSFVGMHPIPILYGLTVAELASMINDEGWLGGGLKCKLQLVLMSGWKHGQPYSLPVKPSPNLPNDQSIRLYPSLCFFEATKVSVGRGTLFPFQVAGFPNKKMGAFSFVPKALPGFDGNPLQQDKVCYGIDLRKTKQPLGLNLEWLIRFYKLSGQGSAFFSSPDFMDKLAGSDSLRKQIIQGKSADDIRKSWQPDLKKYKVLRKKYLLYDE
ncbi:MAG: hypothetical protein H6Q14_1638 [Bacteroidetes bacterium]|jgi:uncharacterized protein YbbC (DUF1343 family)|nr:hypothetical protein [Bacteroidota bacterium]